MVVATFEGDRPHDHRVSSTALVCAEVLWCAVCTTQGAYRALCEKLAVLHHREFGKFRRLKGRH